MDGQTLRELRHRLGHTQARLAKDLGVTANTVARWERGEVPVPEAAAKLCARLEKEGGPATAVSLSYVVARDSHHKAILEALNGRIDPELFEACAADLLQETWPGLTPVRGGSDHGFDGSIPADKGESFPLITTTGTDAKRNLRKNLQTARQSSLNPTRAIFATSRRIKPKTREALAETAEKFKVHLVQIYDQDWFANALYRNSSWCKKLLGITGRPSALSVIPATHRPLIGDRVIGRDEALDKLRNVTQDCVVAGVPGAGKTFVLRALALEGRAQFLIDDDPEALANAIREQQPERIIVDDAHVNPKRLTDLKQLRSHLNADFHIIAVSWPADQDKVLNALGLGKLDVIKLNLIDADTMVDVIKSTGVHGPNVLIHSIVRQAEGRPGLAATLAYLCLRGDVRGVFSGESLLDQLAPILDNLIGGDSCTVLGAFSLGGALGIDLRIVSEFLQIPIYELGTKLARLAAAGVVQDLPSGTICVAPEQLRWVLVRNLFFEGPGRLPYKLLLHRLPNLGPALNTLIGARSRGAVIPELESLLEAENSSSLWTDYASLGRDEFLYTLKHHPELYTQISGSGLRYAPEQMIPLLLDGSVHDSRPLHSAVEHPLRKIQDWIANAAPEGENLLLRRQVLLGAILKWVESSGDFGTAVRAACMVLEPNFRFSNTAPGSGRTITITSGTASNTALEEIGKLWPQVRQMIEKGRDVPWAVLFSLIHDWLQPTPTVSASEGDIEIRRSVANDMMRDLARLSSGHAGVQHKLASIALQSDFNLPMTLDTEFEILYPLETSLRYHEDFENWSAAARNLAHKWAALEPTEIASKISKIETEAKLAHLSFPRLSQVLCGELAVVTDKPVELTAALTRRSVPADLVEPFVRRSTADRVDGWTNLLNDCFQNSQYQVLAVSVSITTPNLPQHFVDRMIDLSGQFAKLVETRCLLGEVPEQILAQLLDPKLEHVAIAAAIGEWNAEDKKSVRRSLFLAWRRVILEADCDDQRLSGVRYWLGEILSSDGELGRDWLICQLRGRDHFYGHQIEEIAKKIVPALGPQQKAQVLHNARNCGHGFDEILGLLVGNDLELYRLVLSDKQMSGYHLTPLAEHPTGSWYDKALLAMDNGYSPEAVAEATFPRAWTWTGPVSEMWKEWLDEFEFLKEHSDSRIVRIGEYGAELARARMERCLEKEQLEAIRGI